MQSYFYNRLVSPEVALAILVDSIDLIQSITVLLTLFDRKTFNKEPDEALLNAPSIFRKTPRAYCLPRTGTALSILLTKLCRAVSVDLPARYAC